MAYPETVAEQIQMTEQLQRLHNQQQAILNELQQLAPPEALENELGKDGTIQTWQSTLLWVGRGAGCLADLASDYLVEYGDLAAAQPGAFTYFDSARF